MPAFAVCCKFSRFSHSRFSLCAFLQCGRKEQIKSSVIFGRVLETLLYPHLHSGLASVKVISFGRLQLLHTFQRSGLRTLQEIFRTAFQVGQSLQVLFLVYPVDAASKHLLQLPISVLEVTVRSGRHED